MRIQVTKNDVLINIRLTGWCLDHGHTLDDIEAKKRPFRDLAALSLLRITLHLRWRQIFAQLTGQKIESCLLKKLDGIYHQKMSTMPHRQLGEKKTRVKNDEEIYQIGRNKDWLHGNGLNLKSGM